MSIFWQVFISVVITVHVLGVISLGVIMYIDSVWDGEKLDLSPGVLLRLFLWEIGIYCTLVSSSSRLCK